MKSNYILICLLLFTLGNAFQINDYYKTPALKFVDDFYSGLMNGVGLFSNSIHLCFNEKTATVFLAILDKISGYEQALEASKFHEIRTYSEVIKNFKQHLNNTFSCVSSSSDFQDLKKVLNFTVDEEDSEYNFPQVPLLVSPYFQSLFVKWRHLLDEFSLFTNHRKYYQAGLAYGHMLRKVFTNRSKLMSNVRALKLYMKGIFKHFKMGEPNDIVACFNQSTAVHEMEFYYEWVESVHDAKVEDAPGKTIDFYNVQSKDIFLKIPQKVSLCVMQSGSQTKLNLLLRVDPHSSDFFSGFISFVHAEAKLYLSYFKPIFEKIHRGEVEEAGMVYGKFMETVAYYLTNRPYR
jgi:hypothetical protein